MSTKDMCHFAGALGALAVCTVIPPSTAIADDGVIRYEMERETSANRNEGQVSFNGGVAGGECAYQLDDGTGEFGFSAGGGNADTVAAVVAYVPEPGCPTVNRINVSWSLNNANAMATGINQVSIYNDPNNDGNPNDVTPADLIVTSPNVSPVDFDSTGNVDYPIDPTDLGPYGVVFVVAIIGQTGADN
ncbi:MAG: hypothetical protein ACYTGC_16260, partial [Planctomycetota bacterium]